MKKLAKVVLIGGLLLPCVLFGQNKTAQLDSLFTALHNNKKFNGNILVAEKGSIVYQNSFGVANEQTGEKLNEHSIFELASVSKQFTAMAIVLLKEKGKLAYEDKISKYIPEFIGYSKNISIKNLLQHTSGLPEYAAILDSLLIDSTWDTKTNIATNKDIIQIFAKHKPTLLFAPNTKWQYSNTGYALLASIIEKASGKTYASFLKENIFNPLQMTHSFVYTRRLQPQQISNYAFGYVYSDSLQKNILPDDAGEGLSLYVYTLDGIVGDGAVNSTTEDLLKWDRVLYTDKLISNQSIKDIFQSGIVNNKTKTDYGFGWRIQNIQPFGNIALHSGSWPGYKTYIERHLDNDKTVIFLENNDNPNISNPIKEIRAILYGLKIAPKIDVPINDLKAFAGNYKTSAGNIKSFFIRENKLYIKVNEQVQLALEPITTTTFKVLGFSPEVMVEFFVKDGIAYKHIATQEGRKVEALKTP
jgi:CubicO group peptidase (beta-lactamase class C family)